jgi:gamma-glutamyltranspeptidase/glutathione hydrolase
LFATGSPGGSRIITTTLQIIMNVTDHEMNIAAATAAPRIHHQWLPDKLRVEVGISDDTLDLLNAMGHKIETGDAMGSTQTVMHTEQGFFGAADPRRVGALAQGY